MVLVPEVLRNEGVLAPTSLSADSVRAFQKELSQKIYRSEEDRAHFMRWQERFQDLIKARKSWQKCINSGGEDQQASSSSSSAAASSSSSSSSTSKEEDEKMLKRVDAELNEVIGDKSTSDEERLKKVQDLVARDFAVMDALRRCTERDDALAREFGNAALVATQQKVRSEDVQTQISATLLAVGVWVNAETFALNVAHQGSMTCRYPVLRAVLEFGTCPRDSVEPTIDGERRTCSPLELLFEPNGLLSTIDVDEIDELKAVTAVPGAGDKFSQAATLPDETRRAIVRSARVLNRKLIIVQLLSCAGAAPDSVDADTIDDENAKAVLASAAVRNWARDHCWQCFGEARYSCTLCTRRSYCSLECQAAALPAHQFVCDSLTDSIIHSHDDD